MQELVSAEKRLPLSSSPSVGKVGDVFILLKSRQQRREKIEPESQCEKVIQLQSHRGVSMEIIDLMDFKKL